MSFTTLVVISAVVLCQFGCVAHDEWQGSVEEREGVVYVRNPDEGLLQDLAQPPIRFELEQVFGVEAEPEEEILGSFNHDGVAVDGDGDVFVFDRQAGQLISFAADGSLRWRRGREGQGPGEFSGVEGVAWDGGTTIWLTNAYHRRLDRWSTAGEFLGSELLAGPLPFGRLLGFLDPTTVALADFSPDVGAGGKVGIVDVAGDWVTIAQRDIEVADTDLSPPVPPFIPMAVSGGFVTVGDFDSYDLRFFDRRGRLVKVFSREFGHMLGYVSGDDYGMAYSYLYGAFQLSSGHWIVQSAWVDVPDPVADFARRSAAGSWRDVPWRSSIDLFDADGRFLYALEHDELPPEIGDILTVGADGRVYTSYFEPFPQVRRYRVEVDAEEASR